ncbi:MAG: hypothetical protein QM619_01635 [Micropruina sp.]|uniref:hypothetical protein n=1 Tax=Micropruina sp. TaxID=2737536 RepID=UPI0039E43A77
MTEPTAPDDDRAERAFRDALHAHAGEPGFAPLTILVPTAKERRGLPRWVPFAAALVLVAAVAIPLVLNRVAGSDTSAVPAVAPERASDGPTPTSSAPITAARNGWRWESHRVLSYQVPDRWDYAYAPRADWCADNEADRPSQPFVDLAPDLGVVRAIGCLGELPAKRLQMFVTVHAAAGFNRGWNMPDGWKVASKEVSGYVIEVVHTDAFATVADQILATVQPLAGIDPNGCPAHSTLESGTIGAAAGNGSLEVSLCQYDLATPTPQLVASKLLDSDAGRTVTAALAAAPKGSGPDSACTGAGSTAAMVRQWRGANVTDTVVRYSGCQGNGIVGGSASRKLTRDACEAVLQPPLVFTTGSGEAGKLCIPPQIKAEPNKPGPLASEAPPASPR